MNQPSVCELVEQYDGYPSQTNPHPTALPLKSISLPYYFSAILLPVIIVSSWRPD